MPATKKTNPTLAAPKRNPMVEGIQRGQRNARIKKLLAECTGATVASVVLAALAYMALVPPNK